VPDKSKRDLNLDDKEFFEWIAEQGWQGSIGEYDGKGAVTPATVS
jgi:hypothetical protein